MHSPDSGRGTEDTFVATIRGRLQHEFHEPGQRDLRLVMIVDGQEHNPTLVAIGSGLLPRAEDRFVGVFSIDRATFDDAVIKDRDPIEAGELVYFRREHALPLLEELTRTFELGPRR